MDAAEMARIHAAANTVDRAWKASEFAALLDGPHCLAVQRPGGFAVVRVIADEAELLTIAVAPERQNGGLGRDLMSMWHAAALDRGARSAFLEVAADNAPARALYRGAGYAETGRRRGYYVRPGLPSVDAVLMSRPLT